MSRQNPYRPSSEYHFVFDRGTFGAVLAGLGLLGVLLFVAGLMAAGDDSGPAPAERLALGPQDLEACRQLVAEAEATMPEPAATAPAPEALAEVPEPLPAEPESRLPGETVYELQLALYHRERDAGAFLDEITRRGYEPYIVPVESSRRERRYTVRIGTWPDMDAAIEAAGAFRASEGMETVIRYRTLPPGRDQASLATLPRRPAPASAGVDAA